MSVSSQNCAAEILGVIPLIMRAIRVEMRDECAMEFSVPQFRALHFLGDHENASLSDLASHLGLMLPAASKIANTLVSDKLAKRRAHTVDRRCIALALTRNGRTKLETMHKFARTCLARHLGKLSAGERNSVAQAMQLLRPLFVKKKVSRSMKPDLRQLSAVMSIAVLFLQQARADETAAQRVITLEQAYDMTLATDQTIRIAYIEIRKANLLPWSALTRLGPTLTGNMSYDRTRRSSVSSATFSGVSDIGTATGTSVSRNETRRADLTLEQPLLDLSVFPAYHLGKLSAQAARLQYRFTVRQTLFGVAQAYYNVLKDRSVVAINQQTVDLAGQQLDLAQKRYDAGDVARLDVSRARATLEDARNTLIQSQNALAVARNLLGNILNLGGDDGFRLAEPTPANADVEPFPVVFDRAREMREDYRVSAIAIEQDIARRNETLAQYAPSIVANATQEWTGQNGSSRNANSWDATVGVKMPFLTGGQREIDVLTGNRQIEQTRLNFEKATKALQEEVKNAWLQVESLREGIKAVRAEVDAAVQNYNDLQNQYEAGTSTSLDVQSALRDLNNARTTLAGQLYDFQVALRDLARTEAVFQKERVDLARQP